MAGNETVNNNLIFPISPFTSLIQHHLNKQKLRILFCFKAQSFFLLDLCCPQLRNANAVHLHRSALQQIEVCPPASLKPVICFPALPKKTGI